MLLNATPNVPLAGKMTLLALIPKCAANIVTTRNAQQVTVPCTVQREHAASKCDPFPSAQICGSIYICVYISRGFCIVSIICIQ